MGSFADLCAWTCAGWSGKTSGELVLKRRPRGFQDGVPRGPRCTPSLCITSSAGDFCAARPQGRPEFAQKPRSRKVNRVRPQGRKGAVVSGLQIMNATNSTAAIPKTSTASAIGSCSSQTRMIFTYRPIVSDDGDSTTCRQSRSLRLLTNYPHDAFQQHLARLAWRLVSRRNIRARCQTMCAGTDSTTFRCI